MPNLPREEVYVCTGFWYHGRTQAAFYEDSLPADKYQFLLKGALAPIACQHQLLLLHDSGPAHTAQSTKDLIKA